MISGKRLRVLRRVWEKAGLRLRVLALKARVAQRVAAAQGQIAMGEALRGLGLRTGDLSLQADGWSLIDAGMQQINELETGLPAEPRPAGWWKHRSEQSAD